MKNKIVRYGRKSKVTVELVQRVSKHVARGIPIRNALAGERVTQAAYERQLQRHPELKDIQELAKLEFLGKTFDLITARPGPMLRWLLERRHPDVFCQPEGPAANSAGLAIDGGTSASISPPAAMPSQPEQKPVPTIVGIPEEALLEAQRRAQSVQ